MGVDYSPYQMGIQNVNNFTVKTKIILHYKSFCLFSRDDGFELHRNGNRST
jgi:hypothetical protein